MEPERRRHAHHQLRPAVCGGQAGTRWVPGVVGVVVVVVDLVLVVALVVVVAAVVVVVVVDLVLLWC